MVSTEGQYVLCASIIKREDLYNPIDPDLALFLAGPAHPLLKLCCAAHRPFLRNDWLRKACQHRLYIPRESSAASWLPLPAPEPEPGWLPFLPNPRLASSSGWSTLSAARMYAFLICLPALNQVKVIKQGLPFDFPKAHCARIWRKQLTWATSE